jgi:hypothetical protein
MTRPVCPVCAEGAVHSSLLAPIGWLDGSSDNAQPRKIHDSHGITLLVSRVYRCSYGHDILGHDPLILKNLPQPMIPFLLWHKTGVMKQLVDDFPLLLMLVFLSFQLSQIVATVEKSGLFEA